MDSLTNNTCNYNKRKGIDVHSGENIEIINNKCRGNFAYGIACVTNNKTNEPLKDYFIKNNVIINCANSNHINGNYGIIGQGECLGIIDGNVIKESGKTGHNIYCVDGNKEINNNTNDFLKLTKDNYTIDSSISLLLLNTFVLNNDFSNNHITFIHSNSNNYKIYNSPKTIRESKSQLVMLRLSHRCNNGLHTYFRRRTTKHLNYRLCNNTFKL